MKIRKKKIRNTTKEMNSYEEMTSFDHERPGGLNLRVRVRRLRVLWAAGLLSMAIAFPFPVHAAQSQSSGPVSVRAQSQSSGPVSVRLPVREAAAGGTAVLESEDGETQRLRLSAGKSGAFTLRLKSAGNYEYIVFQDASDSGTVMDETEYFVDVMVSETSGGTLQAAVVIERDDEKTEEITFTNRNKAAGNGPDSAESTDEVSESAGDVVQESHHTGDTPDVAVYSALFAVSAAAVIVLVCTERRAGKKST